MFCIGGIGGPLIGNWGYVTIGGEATFEYTGYAVIGFGIFYFFMCDDLFYRKTALPPFETEDKEPLLDETGKSVKRTILDSQHETSILSLRRIKF